MIKNDSTVKYKMEADEMFQLICNTPLNVHYNVKNLKDFSTSEYVRCCEINIAAN